MNCKTCGYRLWNLPPGACPECGASFKPSDFDFRRDAVQYVCPKCAQAYYGTDETGHLVPREFDCVRCAEPMQMDRMVVRPAAGIAEERTSLDRNPWADRARVGFFTGWFTTLGQAMVMPHRLIGATEPAGGAGHALSFTLVTQILFHLVGFLPILLFFLFIQYATGPGPGGGGPAWIFGSLLAGALVATLALTGLWTLTIHGTLRLTGPTAHGLGRTFQCVGYASSANCFIIIPCLGFYFGWIGWCWWAVSAIVMLVRGQGVGAGRAILATLLLPGVLMLGLAGLVTWSVYETRSTFAALNAPAAGGLSDVTDLGTELASTYAPAHNGRGPDHASELIVGHAWVSAYSFVLADTATVPSDIPVAAGADLEAFESATPEQQLQWARDAAAALPPNVIAHRVGDFVFTYHGFDLSPPTDTRLWTVIESPDPDTNPGWAPGLSVAVATADGTAHEIATATFPAFLANQNAVRAEHGLPPLPDPATVTHAHPAAAP